MQSRLAAWHWLALFVLLPAGAGVGAAFLPDPFLGITVGGLEAGVLGVVMYRRALVTDGPWLARVLVCGLCFRLAMGLVYLATGFWWQWTRSPWTHPRPRP